MAATDQTYRNQRALDVVFGASCVLMLISIVGMFAQDYYRGFKVEQRTFRDVETALFDRDALRMLPDPKTIDEAEAAVDDAKANLDKKAVDEAERKRNNLESARVKAETEYQNKKADYDSKVSLYNIAVEEQGPESGHTQRLRAEVDRLGSELAALQQKFEAKKAEYDAAAAEERRLKEPLTKALADLKKASTDFDRVARNAAQKRWGFGDWLRQLPVIDGFASPIKIQQITLEDLPIDYAFKFVPRFDRCTTCHLGIDRGAYTRENLTALAEAPDELAEKLGSARERIRQREKVLEGTGEKLPYAASDLRLPTVKLTPAQVNEFRVHPRLDLFVGDTSPHPKEKFGCTACHGGQGSATDFMLASHTPNDTPTIKHWTKDLDWQSNHDWEFPMMPKRFAESTCVKCHHQISDLIREGNKIEAPKLVSGYRLVEKAGCFGCHDIAGMKNGRWVGPDLRLEPTPPLDVLPPAERAKILADSSNPPGTYRKVGPSLRRLSEKTHEQWVRQWIRAPRDFRPTTWMPHFYGQANNRPEVLPDDQKSFPDAEISSVARFLLARSKDYLAGKDPYRVAYEAKRQDLLALQKKQMLTDKEQRDLDEITMKLRLIDKPVPVAERIVDEFGRTVQLPALPKEPKAQQERLTRGRQLFSERGCLACHMHSATTTAGLGVPKVENDAHFGPDLSRVALKLGTKPGDQESARRWLVQWILNPHAYNPRTLMPITHVDVEQADAIAGWLLSPDANKEKWEGIAVAEPDDVTLKNLARVYLKQAGSTQDIESLLDPKDEDARKRGREWIENMRADADERELAGEINADKLKMYIGKRALGNLGCFGCHDIPGYEFAKPIGTPLNDWGKKDPDRLAFEDIANYVKNTYHTVPTLTDEQGQPVGFENGKAPYEQYFRDALEHHQREGFLYQKLREPRSYDFERRRVWNDRLRMPQFKFSRVEPQPNESKEAYEARSEKAEADAREEVMTFILGLVAEPVPTKYVNTPTAERLAEVRGRKVLDKYNCYGCHQVRPGVYEFKKNSQPVLESLEAAYENAQKNTMPADHAFPHNAWLGQPQTRPDRYVAFGFPDASASDAKTVGVQLWEAVRFVNSTKQTVDIPAFTVVGLPKQDMLSTAEPYGGTFADLLVPYLVKRDPQAFKEAKYARAALPPPLLREGEKVQPSWLFQFLKNPYAIRPVTVLRMPKFNMSDEEAMALVNYFAAVDKANNPSIGLSYPYVAIPQRDENFLTSRSVEYVNRLKQKGQYEARVKALQPIWEMVLQERIGELETQVAGADAAVKAAKDEAGRKDAEKALAEARTQLDRLRDEAKKKDPKSPFFQEQLRRWENHEAYATDAYRLVANYGICLNCHQVGNVPPKLAQGPSLNIAWERLRPEWMQHWIASPQRLITYDTPMPQNFQANKTPWPEFLTASPDPRQGMLEQVTAVRDILSILPQVVEMPGNRYYRPPPGGEGAK
jgi:cbb3-type cytochrome oxidase cytochrome c subunit